MACRTASVERVSDKSVAAKNQLEKLTNEIIAQKDKHLKDFETKVGEHLKKAKIDDERELDYNDYIKTEYTSEFSLDKITAVIKDSLQTISKLKNVKTAADAFSDDAIKSYTDLVNSVAEAAKSSSTSAASLSFSMNRLSPGIIAFLSATSVNMREEETFGSEAVTSTIIFYRVVESITDLKHETEFNEALIESQNLLRMKTLQAALTDELANGKLSIEEWIAKDTAYNNAVEVIRARMNQRGFSMPKATAMRGMSANQSVVMAALQRLTAKGGAYKPVIDIIESRLEMSYFN